MFKPGKNRDGYFGTEEIIAQVDCAIDIFEHKTNGLAQGLFMFDNAPSHQKCGDDAISSTKMVKSAFMFFFFTLFVLLISLKIPSISGRITQRAHTCAMASTP